MSMPQLDRRTLLQRSAASVAIAVLLGHVPRSPAVAQTPASADVSTLVTGNNAFALDLYHQLRQPGDDNLIFSPLSVSLALAMTSAGARGDTASQMADTLSFDLEDDALHAAFGALVADLVERGNVESDADGGGESGLRIANALWGEQSYPFSEAFAAGLEEHYGAGLRETDFASAPDAARDDINAWVEEQTEDRIRDIVPEGAITVDTRLVLANAIWFYGAWLEPFDESNTEDDSFHLLDGATVDVPFMYQQLDTAYASVDGAQVVDLPYTGAGFSMTIILPDDGQFEMFEQDLSADTLQGATDSLEGTEIRLWLPKFEFETFASLAETLQALGMIDAFDPTRADFSGMVGEGTDAPDPLVIGDVLHKAFISIDEEGTEAAAATVVLMPTSAAPQEEQKPIEVRIDRPFLFVIRDTQTGSVLFVGRVMNPVG